VQSEHQRTSNTEPRALSGQIQWLHLHQVVYVVRSHGNCAQCCVVIVKRELHQQRCTLYGAYCGDVVPRRPSALSRCLMHDTSPDTQPPGSDGYFSQRLLCNKELSGTNGTACFTPYASRTLKSKGIRDNKNAIRVPIRLHLLEWRMSEVVAIAYTSKGPQNNVVWNIPLSARLFNDQTISTSKFPRMVGHLMVAQTVRIDISSEEHCMRILGVFLQALDLSERQLNRVSFECCSARVVLAFLLKPRSVV
jgi:hypothetical protein